MRSIRKVRSANDGRHRRHLRVRKKIEGTPERPRLVVFRSSKHIYAQLVDDQKGVTLAGVADTSEGMEIDGKGKVARSFAVGKLLAAKAKEKGIAKVVFARGGSRTNGRVKAGDAGARKGGLEFEWKSKTKAQPPRPTSRRPTFPRRRHRPRLPPPAPRSIARHAGPVVRVVVAVAVGAA